MQGEGEWCTVGLRYRTFRKVGTDRRPWERVAPMTGRAARRERGPVARAGASGPFNRAGHDRWGETSSFRSTQQVWGRRMPIVCFFGKQRPRGKKKRMEIKMVNKSSDGFWFHTGPGEGPAQGGRGPTSLRSWGPGAGPRRGPPLPLRRTPSTHVHTSSSSRAWPATSDLLWVVATHSARSSAQG